MSTPHCFHRNGPCPNIFLSNPVVTYTEINPPSRGAKILNTTLVLIYDCGREKWSKKNSKKITRNPGRKIRSLGCHPKTKFKIFYDNFKVSLQNFLERHRLNQDSFDYSIYTAICTLSILYIIQYLYFFWMFLFFPRLRPENFCSFMSYTFVFCFFIFFLFFL